MEFEFYHVFIANYLKFTRHHFLKVLVFLKFFL